MILFFDTFIISKNTDTTAGSLNDTRREKVLRSFRNRTAAYQFQEKIKVVQYTLASYSILNWDEVVIRFECEDIDDVEEFKGFCSEIFPRAMILNQRSDTALKYHTALIELHKKFGNSWIFFSPNNDHPYINKPNKIETYLQLAEVMEKKYPEASISITYSHYTESQNDVGMQYPQWGYYDGFFKKILYENDLAYVVKSNKALLDSIKIYRLEFLINIFYKTNNTGRVIRIEDTEFYGDRKINEISIVPKEELCRHYDSYVHITKEVPPLFIPPGFFDNDIKIRYGFKKYEKGYVNINPLATNIGEGDGESDLLCLLEDVPFFWNSRISTIETNNSLFLPNSKEQIPYYVTLRNPWHTRPNWQNFLISIFRYVRYRAIVSFALIKNFYTKITQ
ncbi:hypothetical protein ICV32_01740 [Polynucleobacter sp. MWH-UH24A]|uniref:hypothetical protein n=1 Tax=Polynucleobacter sp. MWH-UH24A TaxID=2689110 RepID=UPI001BFEDE8E|nr:hypothetical protein [Polynucleobacter sp. MWH-UH24A]QWD76420.1 hypothetical protein ICV32_01740 [Polynucleobacter sp. MWH-UH24A]